MTNKPVKYNPKHNTRTSRKSDTETWRENWETMKPFVKFGAKALFIIGGALISIVKMLPSLLEEHKEQPKKGGKIIKI